MSKNFRVLHTDLDLKIAQRDPMKCIAKVANKVKLSDKTGSANNDQYHERRNIGRKRPDGTGGI
jgi:hypothetical protein